LAKLIHYWDYYRSGRAVKVGGKRADLVVASSSVALDVANGALGAQPKGVVPGYGADGLTSLVAGSNPHLVGIGVELSTEESEDSAIEGGLTLGDGVALPDRVVKVGGFLGGNIQSVASHGSTSVGGIGVGIELEGNTGDVTVLVRV